MGALTIMLIRHAEKPGDGGAPFGVAEGGTQDAEDLAVRGWQRAGALPGLFGAAGPLPAPGAVVAACPNAASGSKRPMHTVAPLAARAGLTVEATLGKGDEAALADALRGREGAVLVARHHEAIPALANALLGSITACPQKWPGHRFDMVWVLTRPDPAAPFAFSQVPQNLLDGDAAAPIAFDGK